MSRRGAHLKKEQNARSVKARHDLLVKGLNSPDSIKPSVANSLTGQHAFAALAIASIKITPLSLNTLKSLANELFAEHKGDMKSGFEYLDSLRVQLRAVMERRTVARTMRAKATRLSEVMDDLKNRLDMLETQNTLRSKAYLDLYGSIHSLIREGSMDDTTRMRLYRVLENHYSMFNDLFDPVVRPENPKHSGARKDSVLTVIHGSKDN